MTFLLTDVEGSTRLWEDEPEPMGAALVRHDAIVGSIVGQYGGTLVKTKGEGDSTFAVFTRASHAIASAVALQRAFRAEPWPTSRPLAVRAALHTGEAEERGGDYFGPAVNRAARLRAVAHGSQVVASAATVEAAGVIVEGGASFRDLGLHRLKDLSRPERIYQLEHPDLPRSFPPLGTLDAARHNLPLQLTSFVGRDYEIREVQELIRERRLVTISGIGGAGKTRLAMQVAAESVDEHPDGVWLVELAALFDPTLVPQTVAASLGLRDLRGREPAEALVDHLRDRSSLLLLDNCEHLVASCAGLAGDLLRTCHNLRIMATSREPLGVPGEAAWRIPPLGVGESDDEAGRLFLDRARLAHPGLVLDEADRRIVAEVCRRLDGIPLAIELAAARLASVSLRDLADRLDDRLRLLVGGGRSVPQRHRTLRAAVDWSHDLLSDPERRLLRRLSVFAGGFTLDAAESVCGERGEDAVVLLGSLVDRSLAVFDANVPRYRMHEIIREYARERLIEAGEEAGMVARHGDWCLQLAERALPHCLGPDAGEWLDRMEAEQGNFRTALEGMSGAVDPEERRLRLVGALGGFWTQREDMTEGFGRLVATLEATGVRPTLARARALYWAGILALHRASSGALPLLEEAAGIYGALGDEAALAWCMKAIGSATGEDGRFDKAGAQLQEALDLFRKLGDARGIAGTLNALGECARSSGDLVRAAAFYERVLEAEPSPQTTALGLVNLGATLAQLGDYSSAERHLREGIGVAERVSNRRVVAAYLLVFAAIASGGRDHGRAAGLIGAAETQQEHVGAGWQRADRLFVDWLVERVRTALGDDRFEALRTEGRTLSTKEAIALALSSET